MEARARRRAHRVPVTVCLLVLHTLIAESFSPDTDTDVPLSTETFSPQTAGLKQTTSWPGRETPAAAADLPSALEEVTDVPMTAARADNFGHSEETSDITNTADWTTQKISDDSTEHFLSHKELTHNSTVQWEGPSVESDGISSSPASTEKRQLVAEAHTVQEVPVTDLKESYEDTDSTSSATHTDSTFISTSSGGGGRTLLLTSNSTSPYTSNPDTSEAASQTSSWVTSGDTQEEETLKSVSSTSSDQTELTSEDHSPTNATQHMSTETEELRVSQGTESQTRQPDVTEQNSEQGSEENTHSTPPLTVSDAGEIAETDVTWLSSEMSYTESSSSVASMTTFTAGEHNVSSTSQQNRETTVTDAVNTEASTEFSTGSVSFSGREEPNGSSAQPIEDTTIQGLATASPAFQDVATTTDDSSSKFLTRQPHFVPKTDYPTNTEILPTSAGPATPSKPQLTEEPTYQASTVNKSTHTSITTMTPPVTTHHLQPSSTPPAQTEHTTLVTTSTVQVLQATSTDHHLLTSPTSRPQGSSTSGSADITTLHLKTSTATPGNTTAHNSRATTPYSKSSPTVGTVEITSRLHTDKGTTEMEMTTTQMPLRTISSPGHGCGPDSCANGGQCVRRAEGSSRCQCLPAWTGLSCTEDVDECVSSPCPQGSVCVNTGGSFSCQCALGFDLEDGRSCTQVRAFLGTFTVNESVHLRSSNLHELHREIIQLLNASLSVFHGYRRSTLSTKDGDGVQISAVNMFSLSSNLTSADVYNSIQMSLNNCSRTYSHCTIKLQHQLSYYVESLCLAWKTKCDLQYSVCMDVSGTPYCQCHPGYFKKNPEDTSCRDCGDGLQLVNGNCVECVFGFGGFNCNNFYKLIAVVVSPAGGALLLIVLIALIITCCRKDKNDINKIIFKSGDLQMSPYPEFPKSNRVSMEWGRETIEMQENGSTKNLLQMTDIYYSPALRNSDLEQNDLYPFSGLPGSRHSWIYPAQWNPSFMCNNSRRRDYF